MKKSVYLLLIAAKLYTIARPKTVCKIYRTTYGTVCFHA